MDTSLLQNASISSAVVLTTTAIVCAVVRLYAIRRAFGQGDVKHMKMAGVEIDFAPQERNPTIEITPPPLLDSNKKTDSD